MSAVTGLGSRRCTARLAAPVFCGQSSKPHTGCLILQKYPVLCLGQPWHVGNGPGHSAGDTCRSWAGDKGRMRMHACGPHARGSRAREGLQGHRIGQAQPGHGALFGAEGAGAARAPPPGTLARFTAVGWPCGRMSPVARARSAAAGLVIVMSPATHSSAHHGPAAAFCPAPHGQCQLQFSCLLGLLLWKRAESAQSSARGATRRRHQAAPSRRTVTLAENTPSWMQHSLNPIH